MDVATALDLINRALENGAVITSLEATDDSQSYRSVPFTFTAEQSAAILNAAKAALGG